MTIKKPWMKFYPADWQADQALRMCSLAARGLWIECMAVMHRSVPYGYLLVNGQTPTETQLGVLVGGPPDHITELLRELETAGVFSRTRAGVIYSRRMTRDEKLSQLASKNGKSGGNPSLSKDFGFSQPDNPPDKTLDKPQILDARNPEKEEAPLFPSGTAPHDRKISGYTDEFNDFWDVYPKKVGKGDALKAYLKAIKRGATHEQIRSGAERYAAACRQARTEKQFTRGPEKWLNGDGWLDEDGPPSGNRGNGQRASVIDAALAAMGNRTDER